MTYLQTVERAFTSNNARMAAYHLTAGEESAYRDLAEAEGMADNLQAVFERTNSRRRWAGDGPTATAPADFVAPRITLAEIAVHVGQGEIYLDWAQATPPPPPAASRIYVWATPPYRAGLRNYHKRLRYLGATSLNPSTPLYLETMYQARYLSLPIAGAMVGFLVQGYLAPNGQADGLYRSIEATDGPIARDYSITLPWDYVLTGGRPGYLVNSGGWGGATEIDYDPDGYYGIMTLNTDGSWEYVYSPGELPSTDVFSFRFKDYRGEWSNWADFSITLTE
jgi:hypothetical protein